MIEYRIDPRFQNETSIYVIKNTHLLYYHCLYDYSFIMSNLGKGFYLSRLYK